MSVNDFVHLSVHSVYSPLLGQASPDDYAGRAKELGHSALAITEMGHLASVPDAYVACKSVGVKYIPGCVLYYNDYEPLRRTLTQEGKNVRDLLRTDADLFGRIHNNRHLTVLCKNSIGFSNLLKLTSLATNGMYVKPRVWFDMLRKYKEGLIILSGGVNGPVWHELYIDIHYKWIGTKPIRKDNDLTAREYIKKFKEEFGDDFYVELQMPMMPDTHDFKVFGVLYLMAKSEGVKCVLTNGCCYLKREDHEIQKVMAAIEQGRTVDDAELIVTDTDELYYKSRDELLRTYHDGAYGRGLDQSVFDELCDQTIKISKIVDDFTPDITPKIPDWSVVDGIDGSEKLREIVMSELTKRGLINDTETYNIDGNDVTYLQQAELECDRFISKGFASYFLITMDLVAYGKKKGWPFGPRGSAGGSLVCYLLGITSIDPLKWGLSFDRFMSSARGGYMLSVAP